MPATGDPQSTGDPLGLVRLTALMSLTSGSPEVRIGLIDGPVAKGHPDLASDRIGQISGGSDSASARGAGDARIHGPFVAGMLSARRGSAAPAICPNCTLLVRPTFGEAIAADGAVPSAT